MIRKKRHKFFYLFNLILLTNTTSSAFASDIKVAETVWHEMAISEREVIIARFKNIIIVPSGSVGTIQSVQAVNQSSHGTSSGAALGGAIGQAVYIDQAFKGNGGGYSATAQIGAAILGAAIGSSMDALPQTRYVFNYAIRTLDGRIREMQQESGTPFHRPVGQCVTFPAIEPAEVGLCDSSKTHFIRKLSGLAQAPEGATILQENSGINVKCRVSGVGLVTIEKNACEQMGGKEER